MTGAYVRVKRDGRWQNIEIEYLTDFEREQTITNLEDALKWLNFMCKTVVQLEDIFKE